jgi:DUF917 family protein
MRSVWADEAGLTALVYGGAVLGGGGGGSIKAGLSVLQTALKAGKPRILPIEAVAADATLVTLSAVGAQGKAMDRALSPAHFIRALQLFSRFSGEPIAGLIASEVGPRAVTYGLVESALTGLPVIDAPADGRAHPFFAMGSLGLHRERGLRLPVVAVGAGTGRLRPTELVFRADVMTAARKVRGAAARLGLAFAVVRNPASAARVRRHGAPGGLALAQAAGRALLDAKPAGAAAVLRSLAALLGGQVLAHGQVCDVNLRTSRGFSVGKIIVAGRDGQRFALPVMNEFLAADRGGLRLAEFPDLVALFDHATALPLSSAEVRPGQTVSVLVVPAKRLILGSAVRDASLLDAAMAANAGKPSLVGRCNIHR